MKSGGQTASLNQVGQADSPKGMFDMSQRVDESMPLRQSLHTHAVSQPVLPQDRIIEYGKKLSHLASELQEFVRESRQSSESRSPPRGGRGLPVLATSPGKHSARSRSKETQRFLDKIEDIRGNLEVEGKTLNGYYRQLEQ